MDTLQGFEISTLHRTRYGHWEGSYPVVSADADSALDPRDSAVLILVEEETSRGVGKAQRQAIDILGRDLPEMLAIAVDHLTRSAPRELLRLTGGFPLRLDCIHVLGVSAAGIACIGLEFHSAWDAHLGAGALFHGADLLTVGKADTAMLRRIAVEQLTLRGLHA